MKICPIGDGYSSAEPLNSSPGCIQTQLCYGISSHFIILSLLSIMSFNILLTIEQYNLLVLDPA